MDIFVSLLLFLSFLLISFPLLAADSPGWPYRSVLRMDVLPGAAVSVGVPDPDDPDSDDHLQSDHFSPTVAGFTSLRPHIASARSPGFAGGKRH